MLQQPCSYTVEDVYSRAPAAEWSGLDGRSFYASQILLAWAVSMVTDSPTDMNMEKITFIEMLLRIKLHYSHDLK